MFRQRTEKTFLQREREREIHFTSLHGLVCIADGAAECKHADARGHITSTYITVDVQVQLIQIMLTYRM